jgi:hypothetical protein
MKKTKKTLLEKIKSYFRNLWFKYVTNPKFEREKIKKAKDEANKHKENFEKKHNTAVEHIKQLMFNDKLYSEHYGGRIDFRNEELLKGRKHLLKYAKYVNKVPKFYEPEICDIHNENLNLNGSSLKAIMDKQDKLSYDDLKKQENKLNNYESTRG